MLELCCLCMDVTVKDCQCSECDCRNKISRRVSESVCSSCQVSC